jgi:hypothetical protein
MFVFYLPPRPAELRYVPHRPAIQFMAGYPTVPVCYFPFLLIVYFIPHLIYQLPPPPPARFSIPVIQRFRAYLVAAVQILLKFLGVKLSLINYKIKNFS